MVEVEVDGSAEVEGAVCIVCAAYESVRTGQLNGQYEPCGRGPIEVGILALTYSLLLNHTPHSLHRSHI